MRNVADAHAPIVDRDRAEPEAGALPVALRPTRSATLAPFVAAPPPPRVARAPHVEGPRATRPDPVGHEVPRKPPGVLVLARIPTSVPLAPLLATLAMRALEVHPLDPITRVHPPAGFRAAIRRSLGRAFVAASALGAIGALAGALVFAGGEALLPMIGWLPGAVLGAAALAGVLGVVGLLLGAIAAIVRPLSAGDVDPEGALVLARVRASERDAVVAIVRDVGGTIAALGHA